MSFISKEKKEEANLWAIDFVIPQDVFAAAQRQAFNKIKGRINIPGFRKGKAPLSVAFSRFGKDFLNEDALDICYPAEFQAAIEASEIDYVGAGNANSITFEDDGVHINIDVYSKPEDVKIENYKGLEAEATKFEVTDEEVQAEVDKVVERNSRLVPVEDRAVESGDIIKFNFEGFIDDVAFEGGKGEDFELTIGSGQFIPGFEDQIIGHSIGEDFDVNVTFPEDYHSEELKGKPAVFKCKVNSISVKELPEVDDEFAQDAADFDTVDEWKVSLKEEITTRKQENQKNEAKQQLFEKIANIVEVEVPDVMVEEEVDARVRDLEYNLQSQGLDFNTYLSWSGMTIEQYREQLKDQALNNVKIRLALEQIAKLEGLEVTAEDIEKEYADFAASYNMPVEDVKKYIPEKNLTGDLLVNKAADFVYDNAEITIVEPKAADAEPDVNLDDIVDAIEAVDAEESADDADE